MRHLSGVSHAQAEAGLSRNPLGASNNHASHCEAGHSGIPANARSSRHLVSVMTGIDPTERVAGLSIWKGPVRAERLGGGFTNINYTVEDGGARYVVRVGDDIPVHQIMRFNERAASQGRLRRRYLARGHPQRARHPGHALRRGADLHPGRHPRSSPGSQKILPAGEAGAPRDSQPSARAGARLLGVPRHPRLRPHAPRGGKPLRLAPARTGRRRGRASSLRSGRSTSSSATTTCSPATSSTTASASG